MRSNRPSTAGQSPNHGRTQTGRCGRCIEGPTHGSISRNSAWIRSRLSRLGCRGIFFL